jgi:hypothetical protein
VLLQDQELQEPLTEVEVVVELVKQEQEEPAVQVL